MKQLMRQIRDWTPVCLRRSMYRAGRFFKIGDDIEFPSVEGALHSLKARGFRPRQMIDIGAYHGEWTRMFRRIFPNAEVLMVEAQESKRRTLEGYCEAMGQRVQLEVALLGAQDGAEVEFVEMNGGTGSSVFEEASPFRNRCRVVKRLQTLDAVSAERGFGDPDFLKVDVQGYELEVLKGAGTVLRNTEFALIECSLIPINQGCPLIDEVIAFMADRDFRLFDFCSQIRRLDGALWQTDLLFINATSPLAPVPQLNTENWPTEDKA